MHTPAHPPTCLPARTQTRPPARPPARPHTRMHTRTLETTGSRIRAVVEGVEAIRMEAATKSQQEESGLLAAPLEQPILQLLLKPPAWLDQPASSRTDNAATAWQFSIQSLGVRNPHRKHPTLMAGATVELWGLQASGFRGARVCAYRAEGGDRNAQVQ